MGRLSGKPGPDPECLLDEVPEHEEFPSVALKVDNAIKLLCNDYEGHTLWAEIKPKLEELGFRTTQKDVDPDYDPDDQRNIINRKWANKRITFEYDVQPLMEGHPGMTAEWYAEKLYKEGRNWTEREAKQAVDKFRVFLHRLDKQGKIEKRYDGRSTVYLLRGGTTVLPKTPNGPPEPLPANTLDDHKIGKAVELYQKNLGKSERSRVIAKDDTVAIISLVRYVMNAYKRC